MGPRLSTNNDGQSMPWPNASRPQDAATPTVPMSTQPKPKNLLIVVHNTRWRVGWPLGNLIEQQRKGCSHGCIQQSGPDTRAGTEP